MRQIWGLISKIGGLKLAGGLLTAVALTALLLAVNSLGVHAAKVHAEIKSMPPGIGEVVDRKGTPPKGILNTGGSHPTALTINTDIEFGNVFPGETQQGEFKVMLTDTDPSPDGFSGAYTRVEYHLVIAGKSPYLDISPYLTIVRDTSEGDTDPDYSYPLPPPPYPPYTDPARASLDSTLGDTEDRWLVTLTLPDKPPKGDYWTTITVWVDSTVPP